MSETMQHARASATGLIELEDSVLLLIDIQDGFLEKLAPERRVRVIDYCRFIVEAASRLHVPIVATVEALDKNGPVTSAIRKLLDSSLLPKDKTVFGCCGQDDIRELLVLQPRRSAILIGLETDVCILHSAVGLKEQGFRAVVVRDAVESPGAANANGLERLTTLGVELIHARGLVYEWCRSLSGLSPLYSGSEIVPPRDVQM